MSTLTITISPETARRIADDPEGLAHVERMVESAYSGQINPQAGKLSALFSQWDKEDATEDPEELKRRDAEMLELQHALNENRKATGGRLPFPEMEKAA